MIKKNYQDIPSKEAVLTDGTQVKDVYVQWLIDENDGAQNFAMRKYTIKPGAKVPLHNHPQDHEVFILGGNGRFYNKKGEEAFVSHGDVIYIPPNEDHGIDNLGEHDLNFLCLIPYLK